MDFSDLLARLLNAKLEIGTGILWREIIGNGFGLASALLGMRRKVAAWPVGIVGNILLFTVFLGGVFNTPHNWTCGARPAGRSSSSPSACTAGTAGPSSASPVSKKVWASGPAGPAKRGLLQLLVLAVVL